MSNWLPSCHTEAQFGHFFGDITRTGFRVALYRYRNLDRKWKTMRFLRGPNSKRTLFAVGERDSVVRLCCPTDETCDPRPSRTCAQSWSCGRWALDPTGARG